MYQLETSKRVAIISALVEGNSIRATCRMTGAAKGTVIRLLEAIGGVCQAFHNNHVRDLEVKHLQADEIWAYCYAKKKNVLDDKQGILGYGDVYTFTAIDADTKLILTWLCGSRDQHYATMFMADVADRLNGRVQLSTDGFQPYINAVEKVFGRGAVDYAQVKKVYRVDRSDAHAIRYSPPVCIGCAKDRIKGFPKKEHVSTSYVERCNLSMRMGMRRFTRLTNAFSKKFENLKAAVSLHFVHYNFVRVHQTLGTTPAVAAGLAERPWTIEDIVNLLGSN